MNIMPHAYQTIYTVKGIFNNADQKNSNEQEQDEQEQYDAYTAGHEHGWTEPARQIYEEIVIRVSSCRGGSTTSCTSSSVVADNANTKANANTAADSSVDTTTTNDDVDGDATAADTAGTATTAIATAAATSNTSKLDLNDLFDTIIITGHSRGGLLAYYVGLNFLNNNTNAPPQPQQQQPRYNGPLIRIIGFGMPSPLKEVSDNDCITKHFIQNNVISVINRYDPVANNTLPTITTTPLVNWWNPILVEIGSKIKKKPPVQKPKESTKKKKTTGSSLWGLVSNVVSIAVNAVTDKATELKYDIENNHTIYQYEQFMTIHSNDQDNSNEDNDNFVILPSCVVIIHENDDNNDIDSGNSNSTSSPGTPSSTSSTLQLLLPSSSK